MTSTQKKLTATVKNFTTKALASVILCLGPKFTTTNKSKMQPSTAESVFFFWKFLRLAVFRVGVLSQEQSRRSKKIVLWLVLFWLRIDFYPLGNIWRRKMDSQICAKDHSLMLGDPSARRFKIRGNTYILAESRKTRQETELSPNQSSNRLWNNIWRLDHRTR